MNHDLLRRVVESGDVKSLTIRMDDGMTHEETYEDILKHVPEIAPALQYKQSSKTDITLYVSDLIG